MSHPVKQVKLRHPDEKEQTLLLVRKGEGEYVWMASADVVWEHAAVAYETEGRAIGQLRMACDGLGIEIKAIEPMSPPPAIRLAAKLIDRYGLSKKLREDLEQLIESETAVDALLDASATLLAYVFRHRTAFAAALFPVVQGQHPRDLAADGLMLNLVQAIEKSRQMDIGGIKRELLKPVERIVVPGKGPGSILQ